MRPNASGITSANTSHTIGSSNVRRIFATRSSVDSITCDIIRRRSKIYSLPFFDFNVELLMRAYIELRQTRPSSFSSFSDPLDNSTRWPCGADDLVEQMNGES